MKGIEKLRQQYPQYNDLSDQQLADGFYKKYYSDIPQDQYYVKMGLGQKAENKQQESSFVKETIARPVLQAAKNIAVGTIGSAGDLAQEAVYLPEYLARTGARAIGFKDVAPFDSSKINTASETIRKGFDEITGDLTKPRNKTEENFQTAGEIAGGIVGPAAISGIAKGAANLVTKGTKSAIKAISGVKPELVKAFQDAGVSPRLADVSTSKPTKAFQNLLEVFPGSASTIQKATQNQIDDITKQLAGITKNEGGTIQQTGKQIQEGATEFKGFVKNRVNKLYDDLDKFILSEDQKATHPKLMAAIDEWTSLKDLESHLVGSVTGRTGIAGEINKQASKQLGFWRNRTKAEASEFLSNAAQDARGLNNIKKQIASQEKIISGFEKYLSPEQFESALMAGQRKIPTNNLAALAQDSQIQDIAAVGAGDTARVLSRYSQIVDDAGQISYPRLKTFRSTVGAKLQSPSLSGDERLGLKKIYGALSEDMKSAVVGNGGEKGLRAFNKANNAFGRSQELLEKSINPLIDAKTPEAVYQLALSGSKQGGSNIKPIMTALKPEQKEFVRGTIVKRMGLQNAGLQDSTGEIFSPNKFLTEWNKLSPEAQRNIFKPEQVNGINNLNKAIFNIKETSKIAQKSNNLPYLNWLGLIGATVASPVTAAQAAGSVAGARISAELMTSPKFINWLAKAPKVKPTEIPKHLKELSIIASQNPALREDILDYIDSITIDEGGQE